MKIDQNIFKGRYRIGSFKNCKNCKNCKNLLSVKRMVVSIFPSKYICLIFKENFQFEYRNEYTFLNSNY